MARRGNDGSPAPTGRLTPTGIGQLTFARSVRGYDPAQVDAALREIRTSYAEMWHEREELERRSNEVAERLTLLEHDRDAIGAALIQARRTATELEASARQEADSCVEEARARAREITQDAQAAADQLARESDERMAQLAEETRLRVETDTQQARQEVSRLRAEVERLEGLEGEMRAGYRAFLLAALELLERDGTPSLPGDDSGAPSDGHVAAQLDEGEPEQPVAESEPDHPQVEAEPEQPPAATRVA